MDQETTNVLWREVVGNGFIIPGIDSDVVYRPRIHFEQSDKHCKQMNVQLPEFICSSVKSVELGFLKVLGFPFIKFLLGPREGIHRTNIFQDGINRADLVSFEKELSFTDESGTCLLKKDAKAFFPSDPAKIVLVFVDGSKAEFNFNNLKVSGGLRAFAEEKGMELGDKFVFMKRLEGKDVFLGLRRALPHRVSGQEIVEAVKQASKGSNYSVTVFPHENWLSCVNMG